MEGVWTLPEFEFLKDNIWIGTEKIDGTNIRIIYIPYSDVFPEYPGGELIFKGKTDNAQLANYMIEPLNKIFNKEALGRVFTESKVCLYGELYGPKVQSGGRYSKEHKFILFDIKIDEWWLKREDVEEIATKLNIQIVPEVFTGTLQEAISYVRKGRLSVISEDPTLIAKGLILKPAVDLQARNGNRIITKIKHCDFK